MLKNGSNFPVMRCSHDIHIFHASWTNIPISFPAFFVRFRKQKKPGSRSNAILLNCLWRFHRHLTLKFTLKLISKPDRKRKRTKTSLRHPELKTFSISAGWTILNYCSDSEHKVIKWCWRISGGRTVPVEAEGKAGKGDMSLSTTLLPGPFRRRECGITVEMRLLLRKNK